MYIFFTSLKICGMIRSKRTGACFFRATLEPVGWFLSIKLARLQVRCGAIQLSEYTVSSGTSVALSNTIWYPSGSDIEVVQRLFLTTGTVASIPFE